MSRRDRARLSAIDAAGAPGRGRATVVTVEDAAFIARVESSEIAFSKNDVLVCDVRETAHQTAKGLKADYSIVRVIEHRRAGHQPHLEL